MATYILYTTGQHQRLPRHLLAQQISRPPFIFNCLGSTTSRRHKARHCCEQQDGIISFHLSAFTLLLNELIRRFAGSEPVCSLRVAVTSHLLCSTKPGPFHYIRAAPFSRLKSKLDLIYLFLIKKLLGGNHNITFHLVQPGGFE